MPSIRLLFVLRSMLGACLCLLPATAAFAQPIAWTGAGDGVSWNQPANWSPVGLPGSTSNVIIPAGAPINLNVAATVSTLSTDRAITQTSGCNALTITGGLNLGPAGSITTTTSACNNLTFSGTQSITGSGVINLNSGYMTVAGSSATLTVGSGIVVQAANNAANIVINAGNTLLNQGTIRANAASRTVNIGGSATGNLTNDTTGVIEASNTGAVVIATVNWTNNGTFLVNNGSLSLGGSFNALGTISRTGGSIGISGNYSGATIAANAANGSFNLGGGAVFNGTTFNAADGQSFSLTSAFTINGCTLNAPLTLNGGCNALTITGGLVLGANGSITTTTAGCNNLTFSGTQSVTGSGVINLNSGYMTIAGSSATLTVGAGIVVQAANNGANIVINAGNTLLNQGTIRANAASRTVNIGGSATGNLTNDTTGVIEASNTGAVVIATVNWTNNGTLLVNNGTLNLGGTGAALGTISRTGGTINLTGSYTGSTLTISNATGAIAFGAGTAFDGTTLNALDGQTYSFTNSFTMNACTLNAPLTANGGCNAVTITGGLVLGANGSITTSTASCNNIVFSGTQSVTGSGFIRLNSGYMTISGSSATLTIANGITVEAANNAANIVINAGNTLLNQGTIRANAASRTVNIGGSATGNLTNDTTGVIEASNTGTVVIATVNWTNNGTLLVNNGTLNLGGTGAALGTISRTGGTINLTGSYTGPTLTISNATGAIVFGAGTAFNGTTLNALDGQTYSFTNAFTMNACTLNAPLTANGGCNAVTITGGLVLGAGGSITTSTASCNNIVFSGTQSVTGSGQIILANGYAIVSGTGAVLTVGNGITIRNTGLHNANLYISAGASLVNLGTITATGATRSLTINGTPTSTFSNQPGATLSAFSAGQLIVDNNLANSGRIVAGTNGTVVLAAGRTLTNAADGEIELQGTGPNSTTDFGHLRILGTLNAGGLLAVTYPNGLVPGCRIAVPIITTQGAGTISGQFATRTGPPKPSPFAIYFSVTPTGAIFSSTNLADVGSAGAVPQPDGVLDNNDFIVFIDLFFSLNPIADRGSTGGVPGADGAWDNNDFIVYIDQFFAGCG